MMTSSTVTFSPGSLVSVRGREWLVLPKPDDADPNLLLLRPIDGSEEETTGVLTNLEEVVAAQFAPPRLPTDDEIRDGRGPVLGRNRSCAFLRDALRLSVRNSAGPFRSFGKIAVEPRPYQYVPLVLALRQNPTRLLIADDVGIGKTIETGMILRELLDRGEIKRFCVVCPPYLAEQWERELYEKFAIDAKVVLPSTAVKLERECAADESLFDVYPFTIVSIDFIKADRRRAEFLRTAPEAVVFDEAHAVAHDFELSGRHQRYDLARELCDDANRHIILVTATPHSGKENAFRALLGLVNPEFMDENKYPDDLSGDENAKKRMEIAKYFVMRRRGDVVDFLGEKSDFPECLDDERSWKLSPQYNDFLQKTINFAKELVEDERGGKCATRIRWWSALALLRSIASSPMAASATLRQRSVLAGADGEEADGADANSERRYQSLEHLGKSYVLDADAADADNVNDSPLGADCDPVDAAADSDAAGASQSRRAAKMRELAKEADALRGMERDFKLKELVAILKALLKEDRAPIVFCRFIPTVHYLREELAKALPKTTVVGVTGELPPDERERRVLELGSEEKRVLVCTDCLSEGVNLQERFDSVVHYDLSWNPTRHEQREGRVNRFGQPKRDTRVVTFYGEDNGIDGFVLEVLLRKHKSIKKSLGLSVPLPTDSQKLVETMVNGLLKHNERYNVSSSRKAGKKSAQHTMVFPEVTKGELELAAAELHEAWDDAAKREEKRSQTFFAHRKTSKDVIDDVQAELEETRRAIGSASNVKEFVINALQDANGTVEPCRGSDEDGFYRLDVKEADQRLREYLPPYDEWRARFKLPARDDAEYISRAHPLVAGLCDYVVNTALDSAAESSIASRIGGILTDAVQTSSFVLLLRLRFHLTQRDRAGADRETLAEDVVVAGFRYDAADGTTPIWLSDSETEALLAVKPTANVAVYHAKQTLKLAIDDLHDPDSALNARLRELTTTRAAKLKESHQRVRSGAKLQSFADVRPEPYPDIVGIYAYIPDHTAH